MQCTLRLYQEDHYRTVSEPHINRSAQIISLQLNEIRMKQVDCNDAYKTRSRSVRTFLNKCERESEEMYRLLVCVCGVIAFDLGKTFMVYK